MPPATKKRRITPESEDDPLSNGRVTVEDAIIPEAPYKPITVEEKNGWQGFCEIESEPAFFNVMLKDFGVKGVKVQEVFGLDDELLAMLPKPVYGLIFLFRYRTSDANKQEASCPDHVWFANQTHDFACATVSLLNIVNNIADVDIGDQLQEFKDFTKVFTPDLRGDLIGTFPFVKQIHNSFARKMDMFCIDLGMENKFDDRRKIKVKKTEEPAAKKKKKRKAADDDDQDDVEFVSEKKKKVVVDEDFTDDDAAFHFIAFVPIEDEVWKLDGLDRQPEKIGAFDSGDWLNVIIPELAGRMAQYEENQIEFGLLAIVKDPLDEHQSQLRAVKEEVRDLETHLSATTTGWKALADPPNHHAANGDNTAPENTANGTGTTFAPKDEASEEAMESLLTRRQELLVLQTELKRSIEDEEASSRSDQQRAYERRHDYAPLIHSWLKMLADEDGLVKELFEESR